MIKPSKTINTAKVVFKALVSKSFPLSQLWSLTLLSGHWM